LGGGCHNVICLITCLFGVAASVCAEEDERIDAGDGLHADATHTDVYVNDSFEAADAIARAKALAGRRRWSEAAEVFQRTLETTGDKLVRVAPGYYVGIGDYINALISDWPEEGITTYQNLFEREIEALLSATTTSRTTQELLPIFNRYFCTAAAAGLADTIGQLAIEAGDAALAEHVYRRVLEHHPDRAEYAARYRAMLTVIAAMRGEPDINRSQPDEEAKIRWMGQDRFVREVVADIRGYFGSLRSRASRLEWPIFGGDAGRNRLAATDVRELGLLWRFDAFDRTDGDGSGDAIDVTIGGEHDWARYLSINPTVANGLVFVQNLREIVALHRNTGAVAWRFRADDAGVGGYSLIEEQPPGWDSPTVRNGRLYASIPGDTVPYYAYETARSPPELVCLDADTGRMIWRINQEAIEEAFAEVMFDSTPIIEHGCLYVVGRRRRSFGFEDCYLYRFDAVSGKFEHRTHLGSASTGTFGSRQATKTIIAMHGDVMYVCTNLGSIAAVSAHTGAVRWLTLYERDRNDDNEGSSRFARDTKPWHFNPVIWSEGRIIALPTDAKHVMVLRAEDGMLSQLVPVGALAGIETILGVDGDLLCGVGSTAVCYDLATNSLRWSTPLPDEASISGRGVWADDRLLVPSRGWLSTFRVSDGTRSDAAWDSESEGGNLLALPDQVLVAGAGRIFAYVRKSQIWEVLRERMAAAPSDPLPALELAEIALSNREFSEAVKVLDEAVRRAERLGKPLEPMMARRLFDDAMLFGGRLAAHSKLDADLLDKLFIYAAQYAPDTSAHLNYRFRFAELFEATDLPERAVRLYQQVLRDRSLREEPIDAYAGGLGSAGVFAQSRIAGLIVQHGRSVYASHEAEARRWLDSGRSGKDEATLRRLVSTFPNSEAAPLALIAHGDLLARRRRPQEAAKHFARALHRYWKQVDHPTLLRKIADAHEQAGKADYAYLWLTKAAREHPSVRIEYQGRTVTFLEYRERLAHVRNQVEPSRPNIVPPLEVGFAKEFEGTISLLVPRFGDDPASCWSRYFVHTPAGIRAFDTPAGTQPWSQPAAVRGNVELLIATSEVAVFATSYEVFALDVVTGLRRWSHGKHPKHEGDILGDWEDSDAFRAHSLHGRHLLSVRDNGDMLRVAIDTGRVSWTRTHRPKPTGQVRHSDAWVVYAVTQDERVVICLVDATTGAWFDAIMTNEKRTVEDLFLTFDGRLILVTSRSISCYDPESGARRWRIAPGGHIRRASLLLDLDAFYFSDDGQHLKKISLENGRELWGSERLVRRGDDGLMVQREGNSLIVSTASSVTAVDAVTGLTLWRGTTPQHPRFIARLLTRSYVLAVDAPGGLLEADGVAYFYDHRNASGIIPKSGGARDLGLLPDVRAVLAADNVLLVQTGATVRGWSHK